MLDHSFGNDNGCSPNFIAITGLSLRVALFGLGGLCTGCSPTNACGHFPCSRMAVRLCVEERDLREIVCALADRQVRVLVSLFAKKTA
jgi:hypothetical protein